MKDMLLSDFLETIKNSPCEFSYSKFCKVLGIPEEGNKSLFYDFKILLNTIQQFTLQDLLVLTKEDK